MPSETDVLVAQMNLGDEVHEFFQTDLGRYALGRAQQEGDKILDDLRAVDAEDSKAVRELQTRLYKMEGLVWLNEVLLAGAEAKEVLESQGDTEDDFNED